MKVRLKAHQTYTGIKSVHRWLFLTKPLVQFIRTTLFQSHETIDHPLGIVYAVSAHALDCAAVAVELLRPHLQPSADEPSVPPAMAKAAVLPFWDPDFPRHFVLVVDFQQGALTGEQIKSQAEALVKAVNTAVPGSGAPRISMLTLNSGTGNSDEAGAAVDWSKYIHSTLPSKGEHSEFVVPSAGEPLERPAWDSADGAAQGCWLSARNLDDTRALISNVIRALRNLSLLLPLNVECARASRVQVARPTCIHMPFAIILRAFPCAYVSRTPKTLVGARSRTYCRHITNHRSVRILASCQTPSTSLWCNGIFPKRLSRCLSSTVELSVHTCRGHALQSNGTAHECHPWDSAAAPGRNSEKFYKSRWPLKPHFSGIQKWLSCWR